MKYVTCWKDLEPLGIDALTGEACGLSWRILFDVTEKGRRALGRCLGVPDIKLAEPWNKGSKEEPHVGSVMLTQEMFAPLAVFAMLESGCTEVWLRKDGWLMGFEPSDPPQRCQALLQSLHGHLVRRFSFGGTAGDRNIHAMSGRVE